MGILLRLQWVSSWVRTGGPGEPRSKRRDEFRWVLIRLHHLCLQGSNSLLLFYHVHGGSGSEGPSL